MYKYIFAGILVFITSARGDQAAPSFDCAKAQSKSEKLICASAELSALDRKLSTEYGSAFKRTSGSVRSTFKDAQLAWNKQREDCFGPKWQNDKTNTPSSCMASRYRERMKVLEVIKAGKLATVIIETESKGCKRSYSQVAAPVTAGESKLNDLLSDLSTCRDLCEGNTSNVSMSAHLNAANSKAFSVTIGTWRYCDGAMHGNFEEDSVFYSWDSEGPGRELKAADLIAKESSWEPILKVCAKEIAMKSGIEEYELDFARLIPKLEKSSFIKTVAGAKLKTNDATLNFGLLFGYAGGMQTCSIPIKSLLPNLTSVGVGAFTGK